MSSRKLLIRPSLELLALLAIAIGILLRLINLGNREFWYDEVLSLIVATGQNIFYKGPGAAPVSLGNYTTLLSLPTERNLGEAIATLRNVFKGLLGDVHPPLSFLELHFWIRLFGNSEAATHALIVLLSLLAIAGIYAGIADFSFRQRSMFHQIADVIKQESSTSTLVMINSQAWGHILRLAYYIPTSTQVMLLAQHPAKLAPSAATVLSGNQGKTYKRIIWLDSANPVWSKLKTETEKKTENQKIEKLLQSGFNLTQQKQLSGTMNIDDFAVKIYTRSSGS